jgi:hypothetical protein
MAQSDLLFMAASDQEKEVQRIRRTPENVPHFIL